MAAQSLKNAYSLQGLRELLSAYGALWLALEIADYFANKSLVILWLRGHGYWFVLAGVVFAIFRCVPPLKIAHKLRERDVLITLAIGDVLSFRGAVVIGSNTTFDVSERVISPRSIQGQFTSKYYAAESQLEAEIEAQLRDLHCEELVGPRSGKCKRYPIGSVVQLRPKDGTRVKIGYLLAISDINEFGNAEGKFEGLKQALGELWVYIGKKGEKDQILMPVLGTGFSRLTQSREIVVQEIIQSFVAACAEKTFCENLTIVMNDGDVFEKRIDFAALGDYLKHVCLYTQFSYRSGEKIGTPEN